MGSGFLTDLGVTGLCIAISSLGAIAEIGTGDLDLAGLVKSFGPLFAIIIYFIIRDQKREERLGGRLDHMQDQYQLLASKSWEAQQSIGKGLSDLAEGLKEIARMHHGGKGEN